MQKKKEIPDLTTVQNAILHVIQSKRLKIYDTLKICFFVSQKQFWSMQSIYDALKKYKCFQLIIVPFPASFHVSEEKKTNYRELCAFHEQNGANVVHVCDEENNLLIPPEELSPDIIFYEQHWMGNFHPEYQIANMFKSALCICIPYGVMIANIPEDQFNGVAHNLAWLNFVETPMHLRLSRKYADNKGINSVASGYPKFDSYAAPVKKHYWKSNSPHIKRIIWAPHYSVNTLSVINFGTFFTYASQLLSLARSNADRLEFIVKPHPALKSQCIKFGLPAHVFDSYMDAWNSLPNASVFTDGDYLDLFKTSDALILDSLSFISEYLITGKPMCFLSKYPTFEMLATHFNEYGKRVLSLIDIAYGYEDVIRFVQHVCQNRIPPNAARDNFVNAMLKINFGHVGDFIADYIFNQLSTK